MSNLVLVWLAMVIESSISGSFRLAASIYFSFRDHVSIISSEQSSGKRVVEWKLHSTCPVLVLKRMLTKPRGAEM
jgi:hypothetical protein